ncbi:MAG: hypothetical protein AB8B63_20320 [Granulosicoccus sp.]
MLLWRSRKPFDRKRWLLCASVGLIISVAATVLRAEDLCAGLFTGTERVAVPAVAKPPFMKYYREPAFGTRVIRISNAGRGEVFKPAYSTMQAWNADESLLLLYRSGPDSGHLLLDGKTYEPFRELDIVPSDIEEVFWSHTDPDSLYYISKRSTDYGAFLKYSVKADKSTVLKSFSDICGKKGLPTNGNDPQMQSHDDTLFGFRCQLDEESYLMFTYNLDSGEVVYAPLEEESGWEPWTAPIPGPSGDRLWLQGMVIKPDLEQVTLRHDMAKHSEHASVGLTHDGQDAWFQVAFDPSPDDCDDDLWRGVGHLVEHNMQTGECRPVVNEARGYPYTSSGTHISALAHKRPGWVAMSSMGYGSFEYFSNKRKAPALFSEIYLVNTDPENEVVCRLAHHRSYAKDAESADYKPYFGEAHATISPSGTRILFGSDWYDSGSVDAYVIELPAYH